MKNNTNSTVCSSESAVATGNKASVKAKSPADEHPVAKDGASKGKPALDRVEFVRNVRNQVSLRALSDEGVWEVGGTGHVTCVQSPDQPDAWWTIVRLASKEEKNILESRILTDTIYEKQHGTVIVLSQPDNRKFALYFLGKDGCSEMFDKICQIQLEGKLRNSEAQLRQISENNRQLTVELNTLQGKNRETLERNRELEQELNISHIKTRDLEAKFDQTDVAQVIAIMKKCYEKVDKLENGEILRLQKEIEKLSHENEMKSQENSEILKKLEESEKRIDFMYEENEETQEKKKAEELKSWEHLRQLLGGATEYVDGIRKRKVEQRLVDPPIRMLEDLEEVEIQTEFGSDGTLAKKARIDTQKNLEGTGAKTSANVVSGSKALINS